MSQELKSLEDQMEWLADEVLIIKESLIGLVGRIEALEQGLVQEGGKDFTLPEDSEAHAPQVLQEPIEEPAEEESWTQLGQEVLLPRLAAVSFMMVVALILRTVTDNGMVAQMTGSLIGITYASCLIGAGFYLYVKKSRLAPVFPACGALLLYSIIYETHSYFSSISINYVYLLLIIAEIIIVSIGLKCKTSVLLFLAVFGSSVVAITLDFTNTVYALVACIFFVNIVVGHLAARFSITTKLRWYTLLLTLILWILWAYKLNFVLGDSIEKASALGLPFFLPILFAFCVFYIYTSLWKTLTRGNEFGVFHTFLPAVVCGGTFFAANAILKPWLGQQRLIGFVTVFVSACLMGLVAWLAKRQDDDVPGGKEFVTAATVLLVQGLAISISPLLALPVWVAAAGVLTVRSNQWHSGSIRVISYLFQMFIVGFALKVNVFTPDSDSGWGGAIVAALLSVMTLWLFSWCRKNMPEYKSIYFSFFDKKDFSAGILLIIGLFEAYEAVRFIAAGIITMLLSDPANALYCTQSIIINSGIVVLLLVGLRMRNKEILMVTGLVVLIAAIKVFLFDLLRTDGLPLVLSVFSFGVVAATSSVVMRKWSGSSGSGGQQKLGMG